MANITLLNARIKESGFKLGHLADLVGLSRQGLANKLQGKQDFRIGEAKILGEALGLTDEDYGRIFFNQNVGEMPTEAS